MIRGCVQDATTGENGADLTRQSNMIVQMTGIEGWVSLQRLEASVAYDSK
jgi:hypothetical protein